MARTTALRGKERREARLFRIADGLHSGSIRVLRRVRSADRETGLTPQRLSALSVVVFAGPVTMGELADAEQVTAPTISRLVRGLEREGLLRRRQDPDDGRVTRLEATASGRRILEEGRRRRIEALAGAIGALGRAELRTLERAARLMISLGGGSPGVAREATRSRRNRLRERTT